MSFLLIWIKSWNMTANEFPENSRFSGAIPRHYDDYLGPMFFEPYAIEVANRVDPSGVKLAVELAAGTGRVTRHLKKRLLPAAKFIASDISDDMLAIAKEKLKAANIEWMSIDAQDLPFENNSVDLLVCCFGYMFVPDKIKAFSEALRILRSGGMLLFTTWDKLEANGASFIYRTIAKKYLEEPVPETYNLPFSMHDEKAINDSLGKAGFKKIKIEKLEKACTSPSAQFAAEGLSQGGLIYNEIMKRDPESITEIKDELEKQLAEKYGEAPMIATMSALMTRAWK